MKHNIIAGVLLAPVVLLASLTSFPIVGLITGVNKKELPILIGVFLVAIIMNIPLIRILKKLKSKPSDYEWFGLRKMVWLVLLRISYIFGIACSFSELL